MATYITLHTGRKMPILGLGTWQLTHDTARTVMQALRLGYRMIDTSGDYGTQPGIADGLKQSDITRNTIFLVSKVEEYDDTFKATQKNCKELGVERLDLTLIHRPPEEGAGVDLWRGLLKAREEGFTTDIGVSNYPMRLIDELIKETGEVPTVNQIEWSPFGYTPEMYAYTENNRMVIQAYSPLTRGRRLNDETLVAIGKTYGKSPAQILIRWNIELGTVPLPKANDPAHLEENIDVLDFTLADDDMQTLNVLNEHYSALGSLPYV